MKTREPVVCIQCKKEDILYWDDLYQQFLCSRCLCVLPTKGHRFTKLRLRLFNRMYYLRNKGPKGWIKQWDSSLSSRICGVSI